ncbi:hypothetical protein V1264_012714 [Littorina saxatilis]|uniref:DNA-directed DNA polymerase n=1 Tax=Littorina saxatilis TaxID=31220 RepID=A0AAN9BX33_9CAEN
MQPIFKNESVSREQIGDFMKDYAEKHKLLSQPRRTLVGSYHGEQILLATPLLFWYVQHGLVVKNITLIVEYQPKTCFRQFGDSVSNARRAGDQDPSKAILAETFKLLGNSAYGKTLTNVANHRDIHYVLSDEASKLINNGRFQKLTEVTDSVTEVEMAKKKINWSLPSQIGYFVYQYAKLRMLEFHFDFLDKFVSRADYQLLEMDTDSLYMALSASTLEEVVRPELREQFYQVYNQWFPAQACDQHEAAFQNTRLANAPWDPTLCQACTARVHYDKRTPGLFKTEYQGNAFIGLCSKTYFCEGDSGSKFSSKGLNKNQNKLTKESYQQVLLTQESGGGTNTGFKTDGKSMFTYSQTRKSLSFLYIKRVIASDGVSTLPTPV